MAKWDVTAAAKDTNKSERWEYARFLYNWKQDFMDVGNNKKIRWPQVWDLFNEMGNDGWEMVTATPLSTAAFGHAAGDTNQLLFILKRRK